jgi:hypothetical protein
MSKNKNAIRLEDLPPKMREQAMSQLGMPVPLHIKEEKVPRALQPMKDKRIRQSSKEIMNGLERAFYIHASSALHPGCKIHFNAIRLRLANGHHYTPDFFVEEGSGVIYETKGPKAFRGGFENLKVAASMYQMFKFKLVWKDNGNWMMQEILP